MKRFYIASLESDYVKQSRRPGVVGGGRCLVGGPLIKALTKCSYFLVRVLDKRIIVISDKEHSWFCNSIP